MSHYSIKNLRSRKDEPSIAEAQVKEEGRQVGSMDVITARQHFCVDRVNSSMAVATGAPSVKIHLDKNNCLDTSLDGRVLLAGLITEAVCREITREGMERGNFLTSDGSEADSIQSHFIRLQNQ